MKFLEFLTEEDQRLLVEAEFMEMANLPPDNTGLGYVIWIGEVGGQHGPRIKVSNVRGKFAVSDNFVISISKDPVNLTPKFTKISPDEVEDVKDWVKLNFDQLMKLWKIFETGNGDVIEALSRLKKLS